MSRYMVNVSKFTKTTYNLEWSTHHVLYASSIAWDMLSSKLNRNCTHHTDIVINIKKNICELHILHHE